MVRLGATQIVWFAIIILASCPALAFPRGGSSISTPFSPTKTFTFTSSLDPDVTFTRASMAWYFNSSGVLQSASTNTPRFDYVTPTSPTLCGMDIEEARTNFVIYGRDFTQTNWTATNMTATLDQVGLDGVSNSASSLTATSANGQITQAITLTSASRVFSIYVKKITGTGGFSLSVDGSSWTAQGAIPTNWTRYTISTSSANPTIGIRLATSGNKIAVDLAQLETGVDATTPIPTAAASVTRAQEIASIGNLSWFNSTAGTIEVEALRTSTVSNAIDSVVSFDDGTANNALQIRSSSNNLTGNILVSGTSKISPGLIFPNLIANTSTKMALTYASGANLFAANSGLDADGVEFYAPAVANTLATSAIPSGITTVRIGNRFDGTREFNGCIKNINYYSGVLTTAQTLSTTYPDSGVATAETVTVNLASPTGVTIPSSFLGWSQELSDVIVGGTGGGGGPALSGTIGGQIAALGHMLGNSGFLRIGGNSQDTASSPALTQLLANDFETARATLGSGWKIIYGLDVAANDPTTATTQTTYLETATGNTNLLIQIGNEPPAPAMSPRTESQWQTIWNSYYTPITAAYPSIKFGAPDGAEFTGSPTVVSSYLAGITPGSSGMTYISQHYYSFFVPSKPTPAQLLAIIDTDNTSSGINFPSYVTSFGSKTAMTESGPYTSIGSNTWGLSDRMSGGAWALKVAMTLAKGGWQMFLPHNNRSNTTAAYSPLPLDRSGNVMAAPEFYGLFMMSNLTGQQVVPTTNTGTANVTTLATIGSGGNANILVLNNDQSFSSVITPDQSSAWSTARVTKFTATNCWDPSPLIGGQPINGNATWTGTYTTINYGDNFTLKACESALVQIQP